jgi:hypothetical protein
MVFSAIFFQALFEKKDKSYAFNNYLSIFKFQAPADPK